MIYGVYINLNQGKTPKIKNTLTIRSLLYKKIILSINHKHYSKHLFIFIVMKHNIL